MARAAYKSFRSLNRYICMHGSYPEHVIYLFTYNAFTLSPHLTLSAMHTITTVIYKPIIRYITRLYVVVNTAMLFIWDRKKAEDHHSAISPDRGICMLRVNYRLFVGKRLMKDDCSRYTEPLKSVVFIA